MPAPPNPAKKLSGMLITSAQGQLITRKVNARYTHISQPPGMPIMRFIMGGSMARANAL